MKKIGMVLLLLVVSTPSFAFKDCEELKTEIAARLDARGVPLYRLDIVPTDAVQDQKVVGSCEGGTKKITYRRGE